MGIKFKARGPVSPAWTDAPVLRLYTDGSANPNPNDTGAGGWGWVLCEPGGEASPIEGVSGRCPPGHTTNQRAELQAAFQGLAHLCTEVTNGRLAPRAVEVWTDSQYVIGYGAGRWVGRGANVNADLIRRLLGAKAMLEAAGVRVTFAHVKGHAGHPGNEMADQLAGLWRS